MTNPLPDPHQPDPTVPSPYWMPAGADDEGRERPPIWIPETGPKTPRKAL